jgi:hypothetical protein
VRADDSADDGRFVLVTGVGRDFTFCAETAAENAGWLGALSKALARGALRLCRATTTPVAVRALALHALALARGGRADGAEGGCPCRLQRAETSCAPHARVQHI